MTYTSKIPLILFQLLALTAVVVEFPKARAVAEVQQASVVQTQRTSSRVEIVAELPQAPGNITVTPEGRLILSMHPFRQTDYRVMEVRSDGQIIPFPNAEWSRGRRHDGMGLDSVLGIQSDPNGVVWMLDNGMRSGVSPRLVGWNSRTDKLEQVINLPAPVVKPNSFVNDLAVDFTNQAVYVTDTALEGSPALIVIDLGTGLARRVLEAHVSVMPEDIDLIVEERPVRMRRSDGKYVNPRIGANPIALDVKNEWVYYGPMNGTRMYRVRTAYLLDTALSAEQLAQRVEEYAVKPNSDGISIDVNNNIYISEIGANAIGVIRSDRSYERLASASWMIWPDSFSFAPDGYLYSVINQSNRSAALNGGKDISQPPFLVIRLRPLADGIIGR